MRCIDYILGRDAALHQMCPFLITVKAARDDTGDLCRDAEQWGRASDEISWGNNNRKAGGCLRRTES